MINRPAIPTSIRREVLFEARHRCAVCCEPLPLELAHIVPWCKTQDHSTPNLIALCSNCHSRADNEGWGEAYLRLYKQEPCALGRNQMPPVTSHQKMLIDMIVATEPSQMTPDERLRLVSMVAAYLGIHFKQVEVISVTLANSSRVRISLPVEAAERLITAFDTNASSLKDFLDDIEIFDVQIVDDVTSMRKVNYNNILRLAMNRQQLSGVIRLLLSIVLLVLLFSGIDRQDLLNHFRTLKPSYYLAGLAAYTAFVLLWTVRWYIIIRATNENVSFGRSLVTLLTGIFFSMFLPTIVGTDVGRMVEMSRERANSSARVISSVLLDRVIGLIALVVVALVALGIGGAQYVDDQMVSLLIVGILVALIVGWLLFFNKGFMHLFDWILRLPVINHFAGNFRELYQTLYLLHNQPRLLFSTLIVSLIMEVLEIFSVIAAGVAIGVEIEPLYFFIFMPIIWVIVIIPVTIGGLGLREGAFAFFFSQVGATAAHATGMSLIYYSYSLVIGVLGGVIFFSRSFNDSWRQPRTNTSV